MANIIFGRFDGRVIIPETAPDCPPGTRLRLVLEHAADESAPEKSGEPCIFLRTAREQKLEGPVDLSARVCGSYDPDPPGG